MPDFAELMQIFSHPRPNGSPGEQRALHAIQTWLEQRGVGYTLKPFRQYPYFFESIGVWLIVSRTLLALSIWLRWGWACLVIAIVGLLGGLLDVAFNLPLVSWPGGRTGQNVLIEFSPPEPRQEVILSAHYDTKTEPLDHAQRMFLLKSLRFGIFLSLFLGLLGPLDRALLKAGSSLDGITWGTGIALSVLLLALAWALGLNLSVGRLLPPSCGAVDNGAACAVLMGLAEQVREGGLGLENTKLTLALFSGEEVKMQGSLAYVKGRTWPIPALALNLEVMAQNGDYVLWEQDGSVFKLQPCSPVVSQAAAAAVKQVTGKAPVYGGPITSDGAAFVQAGLPTGVLGTYDQALKDRGFHHPSDNLDRVVLARLPEGVEILSNFLKQVDSGSCSTINER